MDAIRRSVTIHARAIRNRRVTASQWRPRRACPKIDKHPTLFGAASMQQPRDQISTIGRRLGIVQLAACEIGRLQGPVGPTPAQTFDTSQSTNVYIAPPPPETRSFYRSARSDRPNFRLRRNCFEERPAASRSKQDRAGRISQYSVLGRWLPKRTPRIYECIFGWSRGAPVALHHLGHLRRGRGRRIWSGIAGRLE